MCWVSGGSQLVGVPKLNSNLRPTPLKKPMPAKIKNRDVSETLDRTKYNCQKTKQNRKDVELPPSSGRIWSWTLKPLDPAEFPICDKTSVSILVKFTLCSHLSGWFSDLEYDTMIHFKIYMFKNLLLRVFSELDPGYMLKLTMEADNLGIHFFIEWSSMPCGWAVL